LNRNLLLSRAINLRSFPINYTLFVTSEGKLTAFLLFAKQQEMKKSLISFSNDNNSGAGGYCIGFSEVVIK
ncbi:hypothetical protein, partial [Phocaeicola vulgatus]|uniref:hypothetical protein n=1 Tax=Phocaeicola vulgatus TaxID=821 RepID=UPI00321A67F8